MFLTADIPKIARQCGTGIVTLARMSRRPVVAVGVAGSTAKTSSAAPATWPESRAARSAASSTSPPRAQLTMRTPGFIRAIASAERMLRVLSVSGTCRVTMSARRRRSSSSTRSTPSSSARSGERKGS